MRTTEIKQEIVKLDIFERIALIEDVWDSIAQSNSNIPMSEWQKNELDRRYKKYKSGEYNLHSWESVHEKIKDNL